MTKAEFRKAEADLNKATRAAAPHVAAKQAKPPKTVPVQLVTAAGKPTTLQVPKAIANKLNKSTAKKTAFKTADAEVSMRGTNAQIAEITVKIPKLNKAAAKAATDKTVAAVKAAYTGSKKTTMMKTAGAIRAAAVDLAIDIRKTADVIAATPATKRALKESAKGMDKVVESIDDDIVRAKADPNYMSPMELFKQRPAGSATRPSSPTNPPHDRKSLEYEQKLERERNAKTSKPTRPDTRLAPKATARVEDLRTNDGVLAPKPTPHGNDLKAQALKAMNTDPAASTPKKASSSGTPARAGGIRSELDQKARNAILGAQ